LGEVKLAAGLTPACAHFVCPLTGIFGQHVFVKPRDAKSVICAAARNRVFGQGDKLTVGLVRMTNPETQGSIYSSIACAPGYQGQLWFGRLVHALALSPVGATSGLLNRQQPNGSSC
jgi:hypothetical protein